MESVKDLIVDVNSDGVSIALMENHRLIELNHESSAGHSFSVGDVYLGKVKKILPSLNAAFVDIGDEKEAFVHYLDLGLYFRAFDEFVKRSNPNADMKGMYSHIKIGPVLEKEGRIENVLSPGQMASLNGKLISVSEVRTEDDICWAKGYINLNGETIDKVSARLSEYYGIPIRCNDTDSRLYGKLEFKDTLGEVLESISRIVKVNVSYSPSEGYIIDKEN